MVEEYVLKEASPTKSMQLLLLLKLTNDQFKLIIGLDHIISDPQTERILKSYFRSEVNSRHMLPYKHYMENVHTFDNISKYKLYIESEFYTLFKNAVEDIFLRHPQFSVDVPIFFSGPVEISILLGARSEMITGQVFLYVSKILRMQFGVINIPIKVTKNNRHYSDKKNYHDTIGNFVDSAYCTFDSQYDEVDYYNRVHQANCNFLNENEIIMRELNNDYTEAKRLYRMSPFAVNYLGDFGKKRPIGRNYNLAYPLIVQTVNLREIIIDIKNGLSADAIASIQAFFDSKGLDYRIKHCDDCMDL
jgi:hypothetical protein